MKFYYDLALKDPTPIPILLAIYEDRCTFVSVVAVLSFCCACNYILRKTTGKAPKIRLCQTIYLYALTLALVALSHVFFGTFEVQIYGDFLDLYKVAAFLIYLRELKLFLDCLFRLGLQVNSLRVIVLQVEKFVLKKAAKILDGKKDDEKT